MKHTAAFKTFMKDVVNLNQTRLNALETHVDALESFLKDHNELGTTVEGSIPQGSWANQTIIRPLPKREFDADVLLELEEQSGWVPRDYLRAVSRALKSSDRYKDGVTRKNRCVRVQYTGDHHVDLVPFLRNEGSGGRIVRWEDDAFEPTDPEAYTAWFDGKNQAANGHLRAVVRLMKYLRDIKTTFTAKSVILTTLLASQVDDDDSSGHQDLPSSLRTIVCDLADYLRDFEEPPSVPDPSIEGATFDHRWPDDNDVFINFRDRMRYYADKIQAAYDEGNRKKSLELWGDVFGAEFGKVTEAVSKSDVREGNEKFIDELGIVVPKSTSHHVQILCTVLPKVGYRDGDLKKLRTVGRDRDLRFEVAKCTVPAPYEVYWKVKNTGAAAAESGDLRGDIHKEASHRESTKYRGQHWVECYIVRQNECLARQRYTVRIR